MKGMALGMGQRRSWGVLSARTAGNRAEATGQGRPRRWLWEGKAHNGTRRAEAVRAEDLLPRPPAARRLHPGPHTSTLWSTAGPDSLRNTIAFVSGLLELDAYSVKQFK